LKSVHLYYIGFQTFNTEWRYIQSFDIAKDCEQRRDL